MWVSFSLSRRFFSANSPSRLRMIRLWWEQAEGHTLKTRLMCRNITVTALSASTLTFSTAPGAQANTSAKVCPGPVLERMLRFPQISSCTMRVLPASTRPTSSTASPARSRREPLGKVPILAPRQESMAASSSSEMPEKRGAIWSTGKNSFIKSPLSLKIQPTCCV